MTRIALALLSLVLSAAAAWMAWSSTNPSAQASAALSAGDMPKAIELLREALRGDNGNAYLWADLGEAEQNRAYMDRAVSLSGSIPAIWVRHANFCFLHDDYPQALRSAAKVLRTVPDYDGVLFNYFDQIVNNPELVLSTIGDQPRATRSWLSHLIGAGNASAASLAWHRIATKGWADDPLAGTYVEFLLRTHQWEAAQTTWASFLGKRSGEYPARNLVFNGNFKSDPLPGPLDWRIRSEANQFETTRENDTIHIAFHGKANVNYDHLSQTVIIPHPGAYRLTMRIKTENLTTNEGLRLTIPDLNLASGPISATNDWTNLSLDFSAGQPRSIRVAVTRRPSEKFDNKIDGSAWIESIRLNPLT